MNESKRKGKAPMMFEEILDMKGPKWCTHPIELPVGCNIQDLRRLERRTEPLKPPSGFHFAPTDEELAFRYLLSRKLRNLVPYDGVRDAIVYETRPEILVQKHEKWAADGKWYFFTTREPKYPKGSRPARHTHDGAGYWKATGSDKHMQCPGNYFALRKLLVYYLGNYPHGTRTKWVMGEIILVDNNKEPNYNLALCIITKRQEEEDVENGEQASDQLEHNQEVDKMGCLLSH
ncbi:uncharacterized protein A4U43_C10F8630 [Asparagus officinalis]|uniref:NAC domain-containing protein n=1 Tax=Asparagus officinalis TaxID=4686 RepID=A0A5P1E1E7_ASPOF|nr:NAC domain-containing protein 41-like [Asparagus officinalis]ONK56432.1 uncharacterized protein A4U43_C10F8630 [Asparagus officinalis]